MEAYGAYISKDSGATWTLLPNNNIQVFAASGSNIFTASNSDSGIYRSTDNGITWTFLDSGLGSVEVQAIAVIGTNIIIGSSWNGVFRSTDNGISWSPLGAILPNDSSFYSSINIFEVSGSNLIAGSVGDGVFLSTDTGASWKAINEGLPRDTMAPHYPSINALAESGTKFFISMKGSGIYSSQLSQLTALISIPNTPVPPLIIQSYPNPFSSQATITFTSQNEGYAEVTIVNFLGAEVARLFTGELAAGEHSFVWNMPPGLPNGMYECVVDIGGQTQRISLVHLQ